MVQINNKRNPLPIWYQSSYDGDITPPDEDPCEYNASPAQVFSAGLPPPSPSPSPSSAPPPPPPSRSHSQRRQDEINNRARSVQHHPVDQDSDRPRYQPKTVVISNHTRYSSRTGHSATEVAYHEVDGTEWTARQPEVTPMYFVSVVFLETFGVIAYFVCTRQFDFEEPRRGRRLLKVH